jgi:hypothetical protein
MSSPTITTMFGFSGGPARSGAANAQQPASANKHLETARIDIIVSK